MSEERPRHLIDSRMSSPSQYGSCLDTSTGSLCEETSFYSENTPLVDGFMNIVSLLSVPPNARRTPSSPKPEHRQMNNIPGSKESSIDLTSTETAECEAHQKSKTSLFSTIKTSVVFIIVVVMSFFIAISPENLSQYQEFSVSKFYGPEISLSRPHFASLLYVRLRGHLVYGVLPNTANLTVKIIQSGYGINISNEQTWDVLVSTQFPSIHTEVIQSRSFPIWKEAVSDNVNVTITMETKYKGRALPVGIDYDFLTDNYNYEVIYAGVILVLVYVLIIFELVHRALAAILGSLATLTVMSAMNQRPTLEVIISWLDFETLLLLFGMMLIVSIFAETGFFDWIALQAYKLAKGKPWPLMLILCLVAAIISAFLDNVTTILLLTPVTIRLCEALRLDPKRLLIAEVLFANIGGTATAVGDPPNVIIASSNELQQRGVDFMTFTIHMSTGIVFILVAAFLLLRLLYRDLGKTESDEKYELIGLRREIEVWRRQAFAITIASSEEAAVRALLLQKVVQLEHELFIKSRDKTTNVEFRQTIEQMEQTYRITNKLLLIKCSIVMVVVIMCFFVSSIEGFHLDLGWIAFLGAVWLLVLADFAELESLLDRVEWATLIFFAALFALMEALQELGLITYIGNLVSQFILSLPPSAQLPVALLTLLWVSALASSFIDNIPFTTAMIPIVIQLGDYLPLLPLVWALAFGACLGGNGTLIGASANVVAAGIAQQHGYGFTFKDFFKVGFPMMLWTTLLASIYLLICHCAFAWH